MEAFWEKGYDSTSLSDLEKRMGINRFSLYATFDDKHELFLKCLDRYRDTVVPDLWVKELEAPDASLAAIKAYFRGFVALVAQGGGVRGCLMTNSAVELGASDERAAARVRAHVQRLEDGFYRALVRAAERGEIDAKRDLRALARYFTASAQGLVVLAKVHQDRGFFQDIADSVLANLG